MKNGQRYRGTMRLEFTGMEIISEESRQRGHAPSYIFRSEEREAGIVAYIRYLDSMNERELRERVLGTGARLSSPVLLQNRTKNSEHVHRSQGRHSTKPSA